MVPYQNMLAGLVVVLFITTTVLSFYVDKYSKENSRNKKLVKELLGLTAPTDCPDCPTELDCEDDKQELRDQISALETAKNAMCEHESVIMEDGICIAAEESGSTIMALGITLGAVILFAGGTIYSLTRERIITELYRGMI